MHPSKAERSADAEAAYIATYTMIIAIICLSGGPISEARLYRYLARLNADVYLPGGQTYDVLLQLARQGYLARIVELNEVTEQNDTSWGRGAARPDRGGRPLRRRHCA